MRKSVMRPGHIKIRVMDMDEAVCHYRDRMGLMRWIAIRGGRVYLGLDRSRRLFSCTASGR